VEFVKLYYDKRLKDPTYYAQHGIRNGKKTTTRNVRTFGKHSELLKITDDPITYVNEELKKMNEEHRIGKLPISFTINFNEKVKKTDCEASASEYKNIGYFIIQYIMKGLNLKRFFMQNILDRRVIYDSFTILRFLTYARILYPGSKLLTWSNLDNYYEQPEFDYQHILRFMDLLEEHYDSYLTWLYKNSNLILKRDSSVIYYDCTNFYCECEQPDEDVVDEVTGEIIEGLRKFGVSKDHRPNPIVEMGLFMDKQGIPMTMCVHPGNTSEQITAIPLEKEVIKMLDGAKFIYCADAGLGSYNIRKFNSMGGRAFIVTQSIKKLSDTLKKAVFNDFDYHLLSNDSPITIKEMKIFDRHLDKNLHLYNDYAYKVVVADKAIDLGLYEDVVLKNGSTKSRKAKGLLKQRIIITFSRKMMEYQRTVRNRQIDRAKALLDKKDPEEIKKGPNDIKRFMIRISETKSGEKATVKYVLDKAKITEEEKYDGFYAVATNLDDRAQDILEISRKRYQIEECFRIMKTNFTDRPINHRLPNRIKAHFMICFTALLVYRLLDAKLDAQNTHITPTNLITTLKNMNVTNMHDVEYKALYCGSKSLDALMELTSLNLDRLHYRPKELNSKIKKLLS
jgi:transposase